VKLGRPMRVTTDLISEVKRLKSANTSIRNIAKMVGLAKSTVQRILGDSCTDNPTFTGAEKRNDSKG